MRVHVYFSKLHRQYAACCLDYPVKTAFGKTYEEALEELDFYLVVLGLDRGGA